MNNIEDDSVSLGFTPAPSKEKMTRTFLFLYQCHNMILDNCSAM